MISPVTYTTLAHFLADLWLWLAAMAVIVWFGLTWEAAP